MRRSTSKIATLATVIAVVAAIGIRRVSRAEAKPRQSTEIAAAETAQAKIQRAMSAGPSEIARSPLLRIRGLEPRTLPSSKATTQ